MKKSYRSDKSGHTNLVPNNPQADLQLTEGGDWDSKVKARIKKRTLFDSSYRTVAGHWKDRDEPDEAEQLRQSDRIRKHLLARQQQVSRERLKRKGAVPTKKGQKLFDQFMREASGYRNVDSPLHLDDLKQIYLAARALDDFNKWIYFIAEVL